MIAIEIKDEGMGMDAETLQLIFEKFYREQSGNVHNIKGHGLGLSYVKKILTLLNGTINVKSKKGKGSTFLIQLPLINNKNPNQMKTTNRRILLVEDDPNFGSILKEYLMINSYEVTLAKNGIEGFEKFKKEDFDLCLLDVMMPYKDVLLWLKKFVKRTNHSTHLPYC